MSPPRPADLPEAERVALTDGADYSLTRGVPRLGVPGVLLCDGPHGVRRQADTARYAADSLPATCFPTASALAATWDTALIEEVGVALGREARSAGVGVLLGPGANIKRTPLCGRNFEYFSEDPHLSSALAAAWIRGVQSTGVGASLKHFAANNIEARRYSVDSLVDERALRELYLASFEYAVRSARPATVMAAYNQLNGRFCTDHPWLLTRVLREEWGFSGAVVSDWGATAGRASSIAAGLDLTMPGTGGDAGVLAALRDGSLPAAALDRAAEAVLSLPGRQSTGSYAYSVADHHALARRVAAAGTVLLRNESAALPIAGPSTVAVLGDLATAPRYQGAGSSAIHPHRIDTPYESLLAILGPDRVRYAAAAADIGGADVAVVVVGLPPSAEVEGLDRTDLELPRSHNDLVSAVAAVHDRVVVVVQAGAPVTMPWAHSVSAIVYAYLGGQAGGSALADVLCGRSEPGGRLAETFPVRLADNPVHGVPLGPRLTEYRESVYVGYRYYDSAGIDVAYPFGHGLSYTSFEWSQAFATLVDDATVDIAVTVRNTGDRAGSEVVQAYVRDVASTVFRPSQELKGFTKLHLGPGESARAVLRLDRRAFAFWDVAGHDWAVEAGEFELRLGASSRDIRAVLRVTLDAPPVPGLVAGPPSYHDLGRRPLFPREEFEQLYGRALPDNERDAPGSYTENTPIADIDHPLARGLLRVLRFGARRALRVAEDSPAWLVARSTIADATPRMLTMFLGARVGPRLARLLVRLGNRRGLTRG